jgi:hypothetical protein
MRILRGTGRWYRLEHTTWTVGGMEDAVRLELTVGSCQRTVLIRGACA